ncbi:hypothetical protein ACSBR1_024843 [Camellia fascicularis]
MNTTKKTANAVGGKTARASESCLRKHAQWYCAADDAFLCQVCDSSVQSANQLASRHERVWLEIKPRPIGLAAPTWHHGFARKARTPRHAKPVQPRKEEEEEKITNPLPQVPEIGSEEASFSPGENEEQLLYRVPIFDPFDTELCNASNEDDEIAKTTMGGEFDALLSDGLDNLHGFLPSDMDLEEFAADVESLLGTGNDDSCGIQGLRLLDCKEEDGMDMCLDRRKVKIEDEDVEAVEACQLETIDWNFDCESPVNGEEEKVVEAMETAAVNGGCKEVKRKILSLDYEAVMSVWACQGSPWTNGVRPEFNPNECWPDFMGRCPRDPCGGKRSNDGGREARVTRYREKRRTRLFSKKIRYQVRKLNAEKRPRMKGRFVKRSSFAFAGSAFPYLINNK